MSGSEYLVQDANCHGAIEGLTSVDFSVLAKNAGLMRGQKIEKYEK